MQTPSAPINRIELGIDFENKEMAVSGSVVSKGPEKHFLWQVFPLDKVASDMNLFRTQVEVDKATDETKSSPRSTAFLLLGPKNSPKIALMFQAAITCCNSGDRVLLVCRKPLTQMPPSCHAMPRPSTSNMVHLDFLYVERTMDLITLLTSFHTEIIGEFPSMILVDALDEYLEQIEDRPDFEEYLTSLVSLLQDAAHFSAIKKTYCTLVVACSKTDACMKSFQTTLKRFFKHIWNVRPEVDGTSYTLDKVVDPCTVLQSVIMTNVQKNGQIYLEKITLCPQVA